ncbi:MAG: hypothetical protein Kow0029_12170 [Candidatus Rifleibacteriota bacterium]
MRKKLLLVEDDSLVATMLDIMLQRLGFECKHAKNSEIALKLFMNEASAGRPFEIVIIDLVLDDNKMAGAELLKELREVRPNFVAILCSGYTTSTVVENYKDYGFDYRLNKPFSWNNFQEFITHNLGFNDSSEMNSSEISS